MMFYVKAGATSSAYASASEASQPKMTLSGYNDNKLYIMISKNITIRYEYI
jgi:hypothetical protein